MTKEYIEFYANMQDILNGCSDVDRTIELAEQLFATYRPNRVEVQYQGTETQYVKLPGFDRLYEKPF